MYNIIKKNNIKSSLVFFFIIQPFQVMRKGYLTHTRTARSQSNLHIYTVVPVSLNTKLETKESVRQRARYLDSLDSFEMADFFFIFCYSDEFANFNKSVLTIYSQSDIAENECV